MVAKKKFWYEMLKRPISIGCQPIGFIDTDESKGAWGIVAYDRELTKQELDEFEMRVWKESV